MEFASPGRYKIKMRPGQLLCVAVSALALSACGGDGDTSVISGGPSVTEAPVLDVQVARDEAYDAGKSECSQLQVRAFARKLRLPPEAPVGKIAATWAEQRDPRVRDAAYRGCRDGLKAAPKPLPGRKQKSAPAGSNAVPSSTYGTPDADGRVRVPPKFTGEEAEYYRAEWVACASPAEEVARDLDVRIDISDLSLEDAATVLAKAIVGRDVAYPKGQFEGCRDGILWASR
jgi:hypothetical protein